VSSGQHAQVVTQSPTAAAPTLVSQILQAGGSVQLQQTKTPPGTPTQAKAVSITQATAVPVSQAKPSPEGIVVSQINPAHLPKQGIVVISVSNPR